MESWFVLQHVERPDVFRKDMLRFRKRECTVEQIVQAAHDGEPAKLHSCWVHTVLGLHLLLVGHTTKRAR